jgi:catechol-2,3-dioxygenase
MRIHTLKLSTQDLSTQRHFYANVLRLPVTLTHDTLTVQAGATQLIFVQTQTPVVYHFAFNIPENQLRNAKAWLNQRAPLAKNAAGVDEYDFTDWNAHAVYFYDPAGNILELIARHTLPNATTVPFNQQQILNVSEIGFATDDVPVTVRIMQTQFGLSSYGAGSDTFAAVGDEHGLFIVVKRGREWHPQSGKYADVFPTTVTFSNSEERQFTVTQTLAIQATQAA